MINMIPELVHWELPKKTESECNNNTKNNPEIMIKMQGNAQ